MSATEIIEGEAREVEPETALIVAEARGLARPETPLAMVALASQMATALKDIVERQRLYAVIQGKKYPQVEAWMTVARMDNVVAREVTGGILRHDDGAYEATVELVRLNDGMVIGRGSALCGSQGDSPWDKRPEPARRSMAVTRATSRAFRQQYSWIMALAGYEPTPAEEMPRDAHDAPQRAPQTPTAPAVEVVRGTVEVRKAPADMELRQQPDDSMSLGFGIVGEGGRGRTQVMAVSPLAEQLYGSLKVGEQVTAYGTLELVKWADDKPPYRRLHLERIERAGAAADDDLADLKW